MSFFKKKKVIPNDLSALMFSFRTSIQVLEQAYTRMEAMLACFIKRVLTLDSFYRLFSSLD